MHGSSLYGSVLSICSPWGSCRLSDQTGHEGSSAALHRLQLRTFLKLVSDCLRELGSWAPHQTWSLRRSHSGLAPCWLYPLSQWLFFTGCIDGMRPGLLVSRGDGCLPSDGFPSYWVSSSSLRLLSSRCQVRSGRGTSVRTAIAEPPPWAQCRQLALRLRDSAPA